MKKSWKPIWRPVRPQTRRLWRNASVTGMALLTYSLFSFDYFNVSIDISSVFLIQQEWGTKWEDVFFDRDGLISKFKVREPWVSALSPFSVEPPSRTRVSSRCWMLFATIYLHLWICRPNKGKNPKNEEEELVRETSPDEKLSGLAFKVAADPYIGTLTFYRIYSGKVKAGDMVWNPRSPCPDMASKRWPTGSFFCRAIAQYDIYSGRLCLSTCLLDKCS